MLTLPRASGAALVLSLAIGLAGPVTGGATAATPRATAPVPVATAAPAVPFASHQTTGDLGPARGTARDRADGTAGWATRALRAQAPGLHLSPAAARAVRWESARRSLIGVHVRGHQYRDGLPVAGTDVLVSAVDGRVVQVAAAGTDLPGRAATAPVGGAAARRTALDALAVVSSLVPAVVTRELVRSGDRLVDTYAVDVVARVPARAARVVVDAASGRVRAVHETADHLADGASATAAADTVSVQAQVFDPNPVVTSRNPALRSPFETGTGVDVPLDSPELTAQLRTRTLTDLDPSAYALGRLSGTWADVLAPVGYVDLLGEPLTYSRSDPRFLGLMAYEHVTRYQRWLRSVGLRDVNAEAQALVPTPVQGYDNSFYQPGNDVIVFGGGGVPDAEDAEVVLHEYGHAMQDAQVPGYGATDAGGSMGEGFGDFNAANFYALTSGGFGDLCVGDWDATAYSTATPPCLRRMDSTKRYPKDLENEVHADGELWSAYLWRLRSHLGTTTKQRSVNAIRLVATMHELLTPQAGYGDAVAGLRRAARALGHPGWDRWVVAEARRTGYPLR